MCLTKQYVHVLAAANEERGLERQRAIGSYKTHDLGGPKVRISDIIKSVTSSSTPCFTLVLTHTGSNPVLIYTLG